jgi:hypothetical protein
MHGTVTVVAPLKFTTTTLPAAMIGVAYSTHLTASGGARPYHWKLVGSSLPAGLTLSSSGAITGKPSATGTSSFRIRVIDSAKPAEVRAKNLSITVS